MRTRYVLFITVFVLAAAGGWAALERSGGSSNPSYVSEHPVAVPETERAVTLSISMPLPSPTDRILSARLERGEMPTAPTFATVMTDTDCTPDSQMISRCRNEVRLKDGKTLLLRHPHDMRKVPCLAPGEEITLLPAEI